MERETRSELRVYRAVRLKTIFATGETDSI
jgi:hypothetical protein